MNKAQTAKSTNTRKRKKERKKERKKLTENVKIMLLSTWLVYLSKAAVLRIVSISPTAKPIC